MYFSAVAESKTLLSTAAQVDRLFDWRSEKDAPIRESLEAQKPHVAAEFEQRLAASILNLNEQVLPLPRMGK